jgi:hypothetical protein
MEGFIFGFYVRSGNNFNGFSTLRILTPGTDPGGDPDPNPPGIPEPSTYALIGAGLASIVLLKKRHRG